MNLDFGDDPATPATRTPSRMGDSDNMHVKMPLEQARCESRAPSAALGSGVYGQASMGPSAYFQFDTTGVGVEDFQREFRVPGSGGGAASRWRRRS